MFKGYMDGVKTKQLSKEFKMTTSSVYNAIARFNEFLATLNTDMSV